jgi:hypothetical protein
MFMQTLNLFATRTLLKELLVRKDLPCAPVANKCVIHTEHIFMFSQTLKNSQHLYGNDLFFANAPSPLTYVVFISAQLK